MVSLAFNLTWHLNSSFYLANSGIPLFAQSITYQILLLIPIVAIEAYVHRKYLKISIPLTLYISFMGNFISTLGGGIALLVAITILSHMLFQSAIFIPLGAFPLLPLEIMVTLIPMFFLSVAIESWLGRWRLKTLDRRKVNQSFWVANAFTYAMLEVVAIAQLIQGYFKGLV
ncbi:MAG: hypothetical protein EA367_16895 [Leptolyngbya sp. DLM2.Bin15]|nr:MAG: hypothetical protein EA367_16895 [Leptolyngbya sp. DLM2.Bin15]